MPTFETEATPSIPSRSVSILSLTNLETSSGDLPLIPTAATVTGIMSRFILMTTGFAALSGSVPSIWSILSRISTDMESMSTSSVNSIVITDTLSDETDEMLLSLANVASCCSRGSVICFSISSAVAPGCWVMTTEYGALTLGIRSGVML